jgi:hypothetical protein
MFPKVASVTCLLFFMGTGFAHEMVPTYPKLKPSHVTGVMKTSLELFNKRQDVEFYDIGVFTEDWQPIPFVSAYRVAHVRYLGHLKFDVYIRNADADRATYVCSQSKLRGDGTGTLLASRICSKFQQ